MSHRIPLRTISALALLCPLLAAFSAPPQPAKEAAPATPAARPNVLLIVVDDLGWAGVGYHAPGMPTPNIDRLAAQGMQLDRFYAYPVCSPTRAALLTGRMPRRFGIVNPVAGADKGLPAGQRTMPGAFHDAGYATSLVGKWHLGRTTMPQREGYDHFYGFIAAEVDYFTHAAKNGRPDWQRDGTQVEEKGYSTDLLCDDAVKQIGARDRTRPFFLQLNLNAPHDPLSAPEELVKKHADKGKKLGLYAAVVDAMDAGIGRVLAKLDAEHLAESTVVVFLSDNGASGAEGGSNAPLRAGKKTVYEGGIRTPAVVRWPGKVPGGAKCAQPIGAADLFPTLADAAGVKVPADARLDGASQWTAVSSGKAVARAPFAVASFDTAVIDGPWKLIVTQDGSKQLFNVQDDPSERTEASAAQPEILKRLSAKAAELTKDLPPITEKQDGPPGRPAPGGGGGRGGPGGRPPRGGGDAPKSGVEGQ